MALTFVFAFIVGRLICVIGQLLMDVGKLTPAHTLCTLVVAGATIPITSFGNSLTHGALAEAEKHGWIGVLTGMFEVTSSGISAAIIFGFIGALIFSSQSKER